MTTGIVCAEDANQTVQDSLELDDTQNVLSNVSEKSYDDLFSEINKSDDSITLESDYKFKETDKINHIAFTTNYTINGNNHVIDADGKTIMFIVSKGSTLTLKNIILKNTNDSAIQLNNAELITENITFMDTYSADYGGAVYCTNQSIYNSTNDRFIDNTAQRAGSAIFGNGLSVMNIDNATFTNKKQITWGLIYANSCFITVTNSVFANATSRYATALYNTGWTTIQKSKFINLMANATAGAVAIKGGNPFKYVSLVIDDCEFINITTAKNGGAIFADINGDGDNCDGGVVKIQNTLFDKNSAEFGGAILQLGGSLDITNSTFTNNVVTENGGAIYTSNATTILNKSTFTNNKAKIEGYGGAAHLDFGTAIVDGCTFTDNVASEGGAIYCYSTLYKIMNSQFKNNTQDDIYTKFDDEGSNITNCGEYTSTINNKSYNYIIRYNGEEIILNPQPINGSAKDKYFNLNDLGLVTPVKDQGSMGACWAFGAAGAFESSFLIATGIELDISENNIQNLELRYSIYGMANEIEAGDFVMSTAYFVSWFGAADVSEDTYDELGKISKILYSPDGTYRTVNAVFIDINDKNAIKQFLTTYGAMNLFIYGASSGDPSYSPKYNSIYNSKYYGNHYVTLVGWDDNFSKNKFSKTAPGNGAWICKNSWGTDWGDGGYFYLSYYDKSLQVPAVGFTFDNVEYYEKLYQNEVNGITDYYYESNTYGQIYTSESGDIIAAVGTYFEEAKSPYALTIFLNDRPVYTQNGKSTHAGYETIKLNKYIAVDPNSTFEIRIQSDSMPYVEGMRTPIVSGVNYMIENDKFIDLSTLSIIAPIKAYTYHSPVITKDVVKYFDDNETIFTVYNVTDSDTIQASFKNANYTIQITNGTGSISLGVLPSGEYLVTITYHNQTYSSAVIVKTTIFSNDEKSMTIAYNAKSPSFAVQFLDSNGNPLKNTKVTFKFDNKSYTKITNAKGIYSYPINPKSKIGKHYLDYVNPVTGEKLRITINVVSRFVGNKNVNMYYYDGHTYKVRVRGDNGQFVGKNQVVTIKIGKKTFKVKTNINGYATLKISYKFTPGKYVISTTYKGQTVKNKLTVKQVLKTKKFVTVKKSAKKIVLSATLKKGKIAIKSKIVKFKVNGKTYKAKTNKNGIAKVTIKKADIKKFKVKKYTIKVSYLNDAVKSTLKVRR